uniref:Guanylate kinase-associated protein mars n=1 Tax=Anopheles minimus TaxID=112268 RepID=A0A182WFQ4_9DIPT
MEYKKFFKNTSMKRVDQLKVEANRQNQIQRAKSRHAMRQTFRHMNSDSEEENQMPSQESCHNLFQQQQQQIYQHVTTNHKNLTEDERFLVRLQRLQQFQELKLGKQQKQRSKQCAPFLPFACKNTFEPKSIPPLVNSALKKRFPFGEWLEEQANPITGAATKTPVLKKKYVKPRVDCWRTEKVPCKIAENEPSRKPLSEKKVPTIRSVERPIIPKPVLKRSKETQQPVVVKQQTKNERLALTTQPTGRALSQKKQKFTSKLKPPSPSDAGSSSKFVTSTVRKHRKPLTFSFESTSVTKQPKATLTVPGSDELFDGISPIEVESSPLKKSTTASSALVTKSSEKEDSLWEPQPVACLSVVEATVLENVEPILVESSVVADGTKLQRDCSVSDWVPAAVHEITSDTIVIDADNEDDDEVFLKATNHIPTVPVQEERIRKPALNESFTISVGSEEPPADVPIIVPTEQMIVEQSLEPLVSPDTPLKETKMNNSIERHSSSPKDNQLNESTVRKRASLIFTEEPIEHDIVPSRENITLEEKRRESVVDGKNSSNSGPARRRSSVCLSDPAQSPIEPEDATKPPKEVAEKTRFYHDKVDGEVNRLQALCDEYAPFLESEQHELNDHCRGLIIAAQGQTNILIKKKLSKFRELIGHYENKWNDRKVRHDDLDGFWVMLALDLDNLDKRFEELRLLKENNWQEVVPEPQPKVKKLQGGGGVRKREKKPAAANGKKGSSSVIADLIRKARKEKQKQKTTVEDLDTLKETVTVVTTPVKRAVRFGASPRRSSLQKRSSLCCTPTTVHWDQEPKTDRSKRHTIFPEITQSKLECVKSILKPSLKVNRTRRAKSVLFLDAGLDTPQTRRRHSSRTIVDTPKPKIKFNDELEIEHIDNLAARTPSRLEVEIQKRRQQSLLGSVSIQLTSNEDNDSDVPKKKERKPRGTPRRDSSAVRRSNRRSARCFNSLFDEESSNNNDSCVEEDEKGTTKRATRSSKSARKKILDY